MGGKIKLIVLLFLLPSLLLYSQEPSWDLSPDSGGGASLSAQELQELQRFILSTIITLKKQKSLLEEANNLIKTQKEQIEKYKSLQKESEALIKKQQTELEKLNSNYEQLTKRYNNLKTISIVSGAIAVGSILGAVVIGSSK